MISSDKIIELFLTLSLIFVSFDLTIGYIDAIPSGHAEVGHYPFLNAPTCGYMNPIDVPKSRIIDGAPALIGEFPWMATIHDLNEPLNKTFECGAVLIGDFWLMTAKHCLKKFEVSVDNMRVYLGSVQRDGHHITGEVDYYELNRDWDFALIKLKTAVWPVIEDDHYIINYICLPKPLLLNNEYEEAVVSGYGNHRVGNNMETSTDLLKATLLISPYYECLEEKFHFTDICAVETQHMTCFGDSGSALVQSDGKRAVVIGLVLRGFPKTGELCGGGLLSFQRISFSIDWISAVIGDIRFAAKEAESCANNLNLESILTLISFLLYFLFRQKFYLFFGIF